MLQGTASNVGKSILATALCRIFSQDGYSTAPFKAWNMSSYSYVTAGGKEVGIGQAVQADAAGVKVSTEMQPLLVKPGGRRGKSRVLVKGKPAGITSRELREETHFRRALETVAGSLQGLIDKYDVVVLEGAGSPAEINVKDRDLANMRVAKLKQTPVLLVADIDRGGALASVAGTVKLLEEEERKLVQGIIINKFRGDYGLLKPGLEILEKKTGKPVVGVIPYCREIKIPEEDSAGTKKTRKQLAGPPGSRAATRKDREETPLRLTAGQLPGRQGREAEYNRLADLVRENLDMEFVYKMMGLCPG